MPKAYHGSYKRAFTFFEVIIIVTVIGFIMGMALMNIEGLIPSSRLKQQSRQTADLIELSFSQAAIEGKDLAMYFDKETRTISLEYFFEDEEEENFYFEENANDLDEEEYFSGELEPLLVSDWDESISLETLLVETYNPDDEGRDFIIFTPLGTCDAAEIIWREESGITQKLELWPLLGKVTIEPIEDNAY
ncbi:MAG: hypothetical protein HQL32_04550 [Planctomycetes bacterium]|nr:hypothetical protein [Planctomycetota bacterium]